MKRPLTLPLAIALALSGTDALALGLGTIHVNSKLNQPLDAEIPVVQGTQGEAEGLLVQLAAAEDFERVGLNRARLNVPLEFAVSKNSRGELVIKVTSKEAIREPFVDFLVEANWPKGRLLREYTVLLDPPVMAPASGSAVTTAAKTAERAPTETLPEAKPKAPPKTKSAPVAAAPAAPRPEKPAAAPKPPVSGEYGPVEAGATLSGIAREIRGDASTNVNQLMLALLKNNPNAFYKDNINALKRGAILRIPSADEVKAVGSASDAAAQVQAQVEDWRGGGASKPTLVADTGAPPEPAKAAAPAKTPASAAGTAAASGKSKSGSERLELVPPKAGKDMVAMADRPGSGNSGSSTAVNELKAELARTKEALTSREQEAGELKSRVKELEDTKGKTDRLITLKDSEIADLQRKLKELQDQQAKAGGTKPAATTASTSTPTSATAPAATPTPPTGTASTSTPATATGTTVGKTANVSKEDIWGNATPATTATTPPAATPSTGTPPATAPSAATTTPAGTTSSSTAATTPSATPGSEPSTATSATSGTAASTTPGGAASTAAPSSTPATGASTTPSTTPATTPAPPKSTSTTAAIKPDAKTKVQPLPRRESAWYEQSWVMPAAIGAGALLLLGALLAVRRRKAAAAPAAERGSIAGAFGDSPLAPSAGGAAALAADGSEEESLRDQLARDPENVGLHLELLSLLYAERKVAAFEDAAEAMHAQVVDPNQPEWLEAKAMGQELAPHNPLFAEEVVAPPEFDEAVTARHDTLGGAFGSDEFDDVFSHREPETPAPPPRASEPAFNFDLDDVPPPSTPAPSSPARSEPAFAFDDLPPLDFGHAAREAAAETPAPAAAPAAPAPLPVDEDDFLGEDGVSTKLDLAKAYLDMGDPEGARSMLEEVLAEGNDQQKGEARRLMAEIR